MMRTKKLLLLAMICAVLSAFLFLSCSAPPPVPPFTPPLPEDIVFFVNGESVSKAEFELVLSDRMGFVQAKFMRDYNISAADFQWNNAYGGKKPAEALYEEALYRIKEMKAKQQLAKSLGVIEHIDFDAIVAEMEETNRTLASSMETGAFVYGKTAFTMQDFYPYFNANLDAAMSRVLRATALAVTDAESLQYYTKMKNASPNPSGFANYESAAPQWRNQAFEEKFAAYISAHIAAAQLETVSEFDFLPQAAESADPAETADFYFDSAASDGGNGSLGSPYNRLSQISALGNLAGKTIRLRSGSVFNEELVLENINGSQATPTFVGRYGAGPLPKIDGNGIDYGTTDANGRGIISIINCNNVTVSDIELFDTNPIEAPRRGVLVRAGNNSVSTGITVQNLYIHDIWGDSDSEKHGMSTASKQCGGIQAWTADSGSRFDKLTIKNNTVTNVINAGIAIFRRPNASNTTPYSAGWESAAHTNMTIENNMISFVGKNAIFIRQFLNGSVKNNTLFRTARECVSGNQIVSVDCKGTVIEKNEGFLNEMVADQTGAFRDGSMLDPDLRSPETVWQYNFSHDNSFGLLTNCTDERDSVTVRYNISVADKTRIFNINYDITSLHLYNNTIVIPEGFDTRIIYERHVTLKNPDNRLVGQTYAFENNLIYNNSLTSGFDFALAGDGFSEATIRNTVFRSFANNLLFRAKKDQSGFSEQDIETFTTAQTGLVESDPLPANVPAAAGRTKYGIAENIKLLTGSPALSAGKLIGTNGGFDFFGNPVSITALPNIGAYNGSGV